MRWDLRGLRRRSAGRERMPGAAALAALAGALILGLSAGPASGSPGPGVAFGLGSSYRSLTNPAATPAGFEQPGFDDSGWTTASAPFGQDDGHTCSGIFPDPPWNASVFPVNGTVYLRTSFALPSNAFGLHIDGTIDNNADVYVNGHQEGHVASGNCETGAIHLHGVPNGDLVHGGGNLVAVKAVDLGAISFFDLQATYGTVDFAQQPTETQKQLPITPAPTVTLTNAEGHPVAGATVAVTLQTIAGGGTLTPGSVTSATTDAGGVATFPSLAVTDAGKYRLVATSEGATATSTGFLIANQVTPCQGSCSAEGSVPNNTSVQASASNAPAGSALAVSVIPNISPPPGVCDGLVPLGAGSFVNILRTGTTLPDFTITWRLDKSIVQQAGNPGAAHFDICLGAENLLDPSGASTTGWPTRAGTPAVPVADPDLGVTLFWGILPECAKKGTQAGPCYLHKKKNAAGDEIIDFLKPAPWDGHMYGG